ncbi:MULTISPECIES: hypothetical protein [Vagococcus]|nr:MULTISPECIES: hypothetical protein [Vagococcus]
MSKLSNKELVWQEKIYINMFNEEVINVAEDYIKEIKLLNKNTNHYPWC